jgi:alkanesulfonate monooxygenase SsuD/methylene tetrahydromethanopterin reductase-like flavin-dependent oxidoreductase (luciferase family)
LHLLDHASVPVSARLSLGTTNKLKLGVFCANVASGVNATTVPERWSGTWRDNLRVARMADERGFDFLLPLGAWRGFPGATGYQQTSFETLTWASAVLASTSRIFVFGTVHVPLFHPVVAAKQMVTADHVGEGRFGLNIVVGSKEAEFEMFGRPLAEHEARYAQAQEWVTVVRRLWTEEADFDFDGSYYQLKAVRSRPKPFGGTLPLLLNAGTSPTGQAFAISNCDAFFTAVRASSVDPTTRLVTPDFGGVAEIVASLRERAAAQGRNEIGVYTNVNLICRPTLKEAIDYYYHALIDRADWEAVEAQVGLFGVDRSSPEYPLLEQNFIRKIPVIGDPDTVARLLQNLSELGFDGVGITLVNYLDELPLLCAEVLPRLEKAGLRRPS